MYEIVITADTNDADYITTIEKISIETLECIKPLIAAIKEYTQKNPHIHNWPSSEYVDKHPKPRDLYSFGNDVFEIFENFVPYGENGIHTIESITVTPFVEKTQLL